MICTMYVPWFGPWPFYGDIFLQCCARAKRIQWVVHSNSSRPGNCPENVFWFHCSDPTAKVSRFFEMPAGSCISGHGLCEFKPFWHEIFREPGIPHTPFYGWCDWDVIHDLDALPFDFTSARFTKGPMCSPIFIFAENSYINVWPRQLRRFLNGRSEIWDEFFYIPLYDSKIIQDGLTLGVDTTCLPKFAAHLYYEKRGDPVKYRALAGSLLDKILL